MALLTIKIYGETVLVKILVKQWVNGMQNLLNQLGSTQSIGSNCTN